MNDLLAIARRLRQQADKPGLSEQEQRDLLTAADALGTFHVFLNSYKPPTNGKDSPIPG